MIYGIYVLVFFAILAFTVITVEREPTSHGCDVLLIVGFVIALLWPLALLYFTAVAIGLGIGRLRYGSWAWER